MLAPKAKSASGMRASLSMPAEVPMGEASSWPKICPPIGIQRSAKSHGVITSVKIAGMIELQRPEQASYLNAEI